MHQAYQRIDQNSELDALVAATNSKDDEKRFYNKRTNNLVLLALSLATLGGCTAAPYNNANQDYSMKSKYKIEQTEKAGIDEKVEKEDKKVEKDILYEESIRIGPTIMHGLHIVLSFL